MTIKSWWTRKRSLEKKIVITLWTVKALCTTIFKVYFHVECVWKTLLATMFCQIYWVETFENIQTVQTSAQNRCLISTNLLDSFGRGFDFDNKMFLLVRIWWPLGAESVAFVAKTGAKDPFKKLNRFCCIG